MQSLKRSHSAFTLAEMIVAAGVVVILGGVVFTILTMGTTLYAQNISVNQTNAASRNSAEKIMAAVASAAEVPVLVNDTGATVTGNGTASGIRFYAPLSSQAYPVSSSVLAAAMSFIVTKSSSQRAPMTGDKVVMSNLVSQGVITSVSSAGSNYTVGFASSVGSGFTPVRTSGTVIPAGSKCFVLRPSAYISVGAGLRYYPRALSVAQDGASAFNNTANYDSIATLLPVGSQTNGFPFRYLDVGRRSLDVNLRVRAPAHGGRIGGFYTFQNLKTTVAYRSAVIQ